MQLRHELSDFDSCEAEFAKQNSDREPDIVANLCMVVWDTRIAMPLWRHNESGIIESKKNMCKVEIFWWVIVNHASIIFNEINDTSNFSVIASYRCEDLKNLVDDSFSIS